MKSSSWRRCASSNTGSRCRRRGGRYCRNAAAVMKVSDHLTLAAGGKDHRCGGIRRGSRWRVCGQPSILVNEKAAVFAVVGYGKLGGWELGIQLNLGRNLPARPPGRRDDRRRA
ncbi:hypothetical protein KIF59_16335 [Enterobacter cloacae subsp. cloacae]|nr:hypothetical protein [Enterobacter cloacae subsp. cloacae]